MVIWVACQVVFHPFSKEINKHQLCSFSGTRSVRDMVNAAQLLPPLFNQVWLWQAIHDHGKYMVESISCTKFVLKEKDPFNLCFFIIWKASNPVVAEVSAEAAPTWPWCPCGVSVWVMPAFFSTTTTVFSLSSNDSANHKAVYAQKKNMSGPLTFLLPLKSLFPCKQYFHSSLGD